MQAWVERIKLSNLQKIDSSLKFEKYGIEIVRHVYVHHSQKFANQMLSTSCPITPEKYFFFLTIKKFLCSLSYCFFRKYENMYPNSSPLYGIEPIGAPLSLILYRNYTSVRFYKYKDFFSVGNFSNQ